MRILPSTKNQYLWLIIGAAISLALTIFLTVTLKNPALTFSVALVPAAFTAYAIMLYMRGKRETE